jgi:hypothetical protein
MQIKNLAGETTPRPLNERLAEKKGKQLAGANERLAKGPEEGVVV